MTDPLGPSTGADRTLRGGSFENPADRSRGSYRARHVPSDEYTRNVGLRVAISTGPRVMIGASTTDGGNEYLQAVPIEVGIPVPGEIEQHNEAGYFRLRVVEEMDLAIFTTGSLTTKGTLLNSTNRELATDSGGAGTNFRIEVNVEAGTYYVKVEPSGDDTGSYSLHVVRRRAVRNTVGMDFELVPAGEFDMGSTSAEADSDERPVTRVRISREFYIGKHEVTQGQWQALMGSNPSEFTDCGPDCPVEQVSWHEVQEFVRATVERTGSYYAVSAADGGGMGVCGAGRYAGGALCLRLGCNRVV